MTNGGCLLILPSTKRRIQTHTVLRWARLRVTCAKVPEQSTGTEIPHLFRLIRPEINLTADRYMPQNKKKQCHGVTLPRISTEFTFYSEDICAGCLSTFSSPAVRPVVQSLLDTRTVGRRVILNHHSKHTQKNALQTTRNGSLSKGSWEWRQWMSWNTIEWQRLPHMYNRYVYWTHRILVVCENDEIYDSTKCTRIVLTKRSWSAEVRNVGAHRQGRFE